MSGAAQAQESAYCQRAHARASSDATLLMAPRLLLQELRFPRNNQLDLGGTTGSGYQFRAGVSFSFVDFYKGMATLDMGEAACLEHEAKVSVKERIDYSRDVARYTALSAEVVYLEERQNEWAAIAAKAAERLSRRVITLIDFTRLQQVTYALDRKLAEIKGNAAQLRERLPRITGRSLEDLVSDYTRQNARVEREAASVRQLDAWQLRVSAGVIAQAPIDWYGVAELSFSFGGFFRPGYERAYQEAGAADLMTSPDELPGQVRKLQTETKIALHQTRFELQASRRSLGALLAGLRLLENLEAENVQHARDALTVESMSAEADVVFLEKFIDALATVSK
jgi:hypothetical protein